MRNRKGFTLVEIMIVVAIIGLLAAIAVPAFIKARNTARRNACINNLRQISAAKDEYALEYGGVASTVLVPSNLEMYIKQMTNKCFCPTAIGPARTFVSTYDILAISTDPTCTVAPVDAEGNPNHDLTYVNR